LLFGPLRLRWRLTGNRRHIRLPLVILRNRSINQINHPAWRVASGAGAEEEDKWAQEAYCTDNYPRGTCILRRYGWVLSWCSPLPRRAFVTENSTNLVIFGVIIGKD
jgi:hypothetical protein